MSGADDSGVDQTTLNFKYKRSRRIHGEIIACIQSMYQTTLMLKILVKYACYCMYFHNRSRKTAKVAFWKMETSELSIQQSLGIHQLTITGTLGTIPPLFDWFQSISHQLNSRCDFSLFEYRFYPPHPLRNCFFFDDFKASFVIIAGKFECIFHMRAATEFF